jgi:hypothetical protein
MIFKRLKIIQAILVRCRTNPISLNNIKVIIAKYSNIEPINAEQKILKWLISEFIGFQQPSNFIEKPTEK